MKNFWKNLFYALGTGFVLIFGYQVLTGAEGQISILGAVVCFLAARFGDIKKFKLSQDGLEAEMRETIETAKATIDQLHLLAGDFAELMLQTIQAEGRHSGGLSFKVKAQMRKNIIATLKELKMSDEDIEAITVVEQPFIHFDYASYVTRGLGRDLPPEKRGQWNEFFSDKRRKGIGYEPLPDELEAFLHSIDLLDDDTKERLADYRHYHKYHTHRRPAAWEDRNRRN